MNNDFLTWLNEWHHSLAELALNSLAPHKTAVVSVDMVVGFCHKGSLSSPIISSIIPELVDLFKKSHMSGIKEYLLIQDAHHPQAEEFHAYPPHCVKGTEEARTIPELQILPFSNIFTTIEKNSLSPVYDTEFNTWIEQHADIDSFIVVGDCTDLCIYSMAMHLRLSANSKNLKRRIIIPANCVATYDMPVEKAKELGALPHDEKLLHPLFLYHMVLNGIEVVKKIR